jgi:hypothetical protein
MHASSICSVHDGIIHAWACVCATTCMWHAPLRQECKCAVYVHTRGWHACMQGAECMCMWCAFMWHIDMSGECIVLVPYLLQLSFHIEFSLNCIMHNVISGKFYTI